MAIYILAPDSDGNCCDCTDRPNPCDPCVPVTGCPCNLSLPPFNLSPDPSYADAVTRLDRAVNCICWAPGSTFSPGEVTATNLVPDVIELDADFTIVTPPSQSLSLSMYDSVTVDEGAVLTVTWNIPSRRAGGCAFYIYECDYTLGSGLVEVYEITTNVGSHAMGALPAGTYVIVSVAESALGEDHYQASFTISSSETMVVNPVVCRWNDSGTVRILEACPKMYIPFLTESTDDWYADETAAQDAIDDQVHNCLAYTNVSSPNLTMTATSGSTFQMDWEWGNPSGTSSFDGAFSINAEEGDILTLSWSYDGGDTISEASFDISDYNGDLVESLDSLSSVIVSSALPYTGRYIITVMISFYDGTEFMTGASASISSSGTISSNTVQALYNRGVDCPSRLNCS